MRDGMRRNAQADVSCPPVTASLTPGARFKYQRQRTGPEALGEPAGDRRNLARPFIQLRHAGDMHDHRMVARAPLGGVEFGDRRRVASVSAEPVDGFVGKATRPPRFNTATASAT